MIDEQLIAEVEQHVVIYNRQKYYNATIANSQGRKYETKDEAWQLIAMKLGSDVETCKKRWKYLRERYVSQRKQSDPPIYEHLSRPYLEKMKFLDQHIQPRKSYRNVPNFLTSPSAISSGYAEYNMDSSKSNGSQKINCSHYQDSNAHMINSVSNTSIENQNRISSNNNSNIVKTEAEQAFREFAAAVASQQLQQINSTQTGPKINNLQHSEVPAPIQQNFDHFRDNGTNIPIHNSNDGVASSSSSMKSPMSSPALPSKSSNTTMQSPTSAHVNSNFNTQINGGLSSEDNNFHMKKPRVQLNTVPATNQGPSSAALPTVSHYVVDSDDDSDVDDHPLLMHPSTILNEQNSHYNYSHQQRSGSSNNISNGENQNHQSTFPSNADFLFSLYQQMPPRHRHSHILQMQQNQLQHQSHQLNKLPILQTPPNRSSEHLLGELVTTELLKMSKERRKSVQKRILEILFFDD